MKKYTVHWNQKNGLRGLEGVIVAANASIAIGICKHHLGQATIKRIGAKNFRAELHK
jgi:hypothetical protein